MSRSQQRAAQRHRGKTYPGPTTPEDAAIRRERGRRLGATIKNFSALAALAKAEQAAAANASRPIPTSGSGRRRAKAARNAATDTGSETP